VPSLTLGTSGLVSRCTPSTRRQVLDAAASHGFSRIDVSLAWGPLGGLNAAGLPAAVRVPAAAHWQPGNAPRADVAYPPDAVTRALAEAHGAGLAIDVALLHKWDPTWSDQRAIELLDRFSHDCERAGVAFGVACPDSHPAAAVPAAPALSVVSVQFNIANQQARHTAAAYARDDCPISARAPLDAGSLLPGFFDQLPDSDSRRKVFQPFADPAQRCAATIRRIGLDHGIAPSDVAIRWVIGHPWVDDVCVGATNVDQIDQLARAWKAGPLPAAARGPLAHADWSWRYGRRTRP
jgi:aryl-alcohol dehydrogenase-like predicted oxidoreductase